MRLSEVTPTVSRWCPFDRPIDRQAANTCSLWTRQLDVIMTGSAVSRRERWVVVLSCNADATVSSFSRAAAWVQTLGTWFHLTTLQIHQLIGLLECAWVRRPWSPVSVLCFLIRDMNCCYSGLQSHKIRGPGHYPLPLLPSLLPDNYPLGHYPLHNTLSLPPYLCINVCMYIIWIYECIKLYM